MSAQLQLQPVWIRTTIAMRMQIATIHMEVIVASVHWVTLVLGKRVWVSVSCFRDLINICKFQILMNAQRHPPIAMLMLSA